MYIYIYDIYCSVSGHFSDTAGVHNFNVEIAKHSFVPDLRQQPLT